MLLTATDIHAVVPGDEGPLAVLSGARLEVAAGEVVDILGPSGSGKSTLLRALARLQPGATADLILEGRRAADMAPQEWRSRVALLPQKPAIAAGTLRDNLLLPWRLHVRHGSAVPADELLRERLDALGLTDVALDRDAARLSVGQQARVALLRVLVTAPRVLLLDEADAALDDVSAAQVGAAAAEFAAGGGAIVRVGHLRAGATAGRSLRLAGGVLEEVCP